MDSLVQSGNIQSDIVEEAFRAIDRAHFMLQAAMGQAYRNNAWKQGNLHMSAPNIYCKVVELLELRPFLRFLNVGSGTGYLSSIVGHILGELTLAR